MMKPSITIITSLFRCASYLEGYMRAVTEISNPESIELLLLHNEPSEAELDIIRRMSPLVRVHLRHIIIPEREGLYKTWNRGVELAQGEFLAVWNVDDIRTPDSLHTQAAALRMRPDAGLCYGSYVGVQHYGARDGVQYQFPRFNTWSFSRSCYLTPFPMWRKSIHESIGLFDEGFRSAGDYDFQLRAVRHAPFVRIHDVVGYYLEAPETGISKSGDINNIERTVCELRYGIFDKLNLLYVRKAIRYSLHSLRWSQNVHHIADFFRGYVAFTTMRAVLSPLSLLRLPINIARYVKHIVLPRRRARVQSRSAQFSVPSVPVSH